MQARVSNDGGVIESAKYEAKTIVSKTNKDGSRTAVLTLKGRPMFTSCNCQSLHYLSDAVTKYIAGSSLNRVKNMMEFESLRASPSFRQAVLSAQNLPSESTHCFDVVEEALTAMVKGYMPHPRREGLDLPLAYDEDDQQEEDEEVLPLVEEERTAAEWPLSAAQAPTSFSLFQQEREASTLQQRMSTIRMFDMNLEQDEEEEHEKNKPLSPKDWQSFVDELYRGESA
jgi:hypothetical protein